MTNRSWIAALLLASACDVALDTPRELLVHCADDAECPSGRCSATIFVCIELDDDDAPPRVVSAESTDERHVAVLFSRPVDPLAAADFSIYVFSGGLVPHAAQPSPDGLTVEVETSLQKQRTYILDIIELSDPLGRPLERSPAQFLGIGEPPSARTPTPLAPLDHQLLVDPTITWSWSALPDATTYILEIATSSDFAEPIAGSPFETRGTELTLSLPSDGTYYWRVTADTSSEPAEVQALALFDAAVHAHCPDGADCGASASWDQGTSRHPLRRIGRALSLASFLELSEVRVAGRGGTAVYEETLVVSDPVLRVRGSFDATFTNVNADAHPAVVEGAPNAVRLVSSAPLELSDLTIRGAGGTALILDSIAGLLATRVRVVGVGGGRALDARLCDDAPVRFEGGSFATTPTTLGAAPADSRISGCKPLMVDTAITGGAVSITNGSRLQLVRSSIEIDDGPLVEEPTYTGPVVTAVRVVDSFLELRDHSRIRAGVEGEHGTHVGIDVLNSYVDIDASTVIAAKPAFAECDPIPCQGEAKAIVGRGEFGPFSTNLLVTNSVLNAANALTAAGQERFGTALHWLGGGQVAVLHSIMYSRDGIGMNLDAILSGDNVEVLNSAFACDGSGRGLDSIQNELPRLLRSSVVVGCDEPAVIGGTVHTNSSTLVALADVSHAVIDFDLLAAPVVGSFPGYVGTDGLASTSDDSWACGPGLASAGADSRLAVCGGSGTSACRAVAERDADGRDRTPPTSIGPIEVD